MLNVIEHKSKRREPRTASQDCLTIGDGALMIPRRERGMTRKQPSPAPGISYTTRAGWLLAHNSVRPTVDTRGGVKGFRRFWVAPDPKWKLCECGWRPELGAHYSQLAEKAE